MGISVVVVPLGSRRLSMSSILLIGSSAFYGFRIFSSCSLHMIRSTCIIETFSGFERGGAHFRVSFIAVSTLCTASFSSGSKGHELFAELRVREGATLS